MEMKSNEMNKNSTVSKGKTKKKWEQSYDNCIHDITIEMCSFPLIQGFSVVLFRLFWLNTYILLLGRYWQSLFLSHTHALILPELIDWLIYLSSIAIVLIWEYVQRLWCCACALAFVCRSINNKNRFDGLIQFNSRY